MLKVYRLFNHASDAGQLGCKLRGQHVFDYIVEQAEGGDGFPFSVSPYPEPDRNEQPQFSFPARGPAIIFADLDELVDRLDVWDEFQRLEFMTIVDVHFPLGAARPAYLAIQPGRNDETRDSAIDEAVRDRWEDPARLGRARRILYSAHVVTSPRLDWAKLIDPISVLHLPDVADPASAAQFFMAFTRAVDRAAVAAYGDRMSRGQRLTAAVRRTIARLMKPSIRRNVRKDFEQADLDWSYASEPE
jgi:hypothetical protein